MGLNTHEQRLKRALAKVPVRFAHDGQAMQIAQMVHTCHVGIPRCEWKKIYPYWMVAEHDGEMVGCVQLCYSSPIARLEFMSFVPGLAFKTRAIAVKGMLMMAARTLKKTEGVTAVAGTLDFAQKSFRDILKDEGCRVALSGQVLVMEFE
jgi:hypothetical protein